ncbi:hypothetical protein [Micromonospora lutea]|uniref:Uncharacterized protein n=1 Tax=Micromonospora lutea TaxID=419825 RepID=A0ABQ4J0J1_9ACTN|nr:hypothetical protein [Micromonospora lutea]GIJ23612.1 hypothetical protein Vlu01_42360 [Micromonospora lutea]
MNAFDLSPAQIRNRLILRARQAALDADRRRQPARRPPGTGDGPPAGRPCVSVAAEDVVRLAESDHRHATGPLRLRIVRIRPDISEWYEGEWVWLEGVEVGPDDQNGPFQPVLARAAELQLPATP